MIVRYGRYGHWRMMNPAKRDRFCNPPQETIMKWETPEAIDMRYGMEITMYISNR